MNQNTAKAKTEDVTDEELLDLYLSLPRKQREQRFVDTRHAAEFTGLSVRTIQLWIEIGAIRAIVVGKNYRADLNSVRHHLKRQMNNC
jgi:excisionase family DNA binding protein